MKFTRRCATGGAMLCVTDTDEGDTPYVSTSDYGYIRLAPHSLRRRRSARLGGTYRSASPASHVRLFHARGRGAGNEVRAAPAGVVECREGLVSCPINSRPKTRRESTPCCVTNPRQVCAPKRGAGAPLGMRPRRCAQERDSAGALASRSRVASPQAGPLLRRTRAHLAVVRALPDADFAGFPTGHGLLATGFRPTFPNAGVIPRISGTGH